MIHHLLNLLFTLIPFVYITPSTASLITSDHTSFESLAASHEVVRDMIPNQSTFNNNPHSQHNLESRSASSNKDTVHVIGGRGFFSTYCWKNGNEPYTYLNANLEITVIPSSSSKDKTPHQPLANMDGGLATIRIELFSNNSPLTGFSLINTWNLDDSKVNGHVWTFKEKDMQPRPGGTFKFPEESLHCNDHNVDGYLTFSVTASDSNGQPFGIQAQFPGTIVYDIYKII